jgi:alpha-glucosidase
MLSLYRDGLRLRRALRGELRWISEPGTVLAFARGDGFACIVNFGPEAIPLPPGDVLIASRDLQGGAIPEDTTVWVRQAGQSE